MSFGLSRLPPRGRGPTCGQPHPETLSSRGGKFPMALWPIAQARARLTAKEGAVIIRVVTFSPDNFCMVMSMPKSRATMLIAI
jgi:hypothetical protein